MKKGMCLILAVLTVLCACSAFAEQKVQLPDSAYSVTVPDGMTYDGPGENPDDAKFVWLSEKLGLEIQFFCYGNEKGASLQSIAEILQEEYETVQVRLISGIEMIVYELEDPGDPPEKGMKCVGYVLTDGDMIQEICFWYATQAAADETAVIIESITDKD